MSAVEPRSRRLTAIDWIAASIGAVPTLVCAAVLVEWSPRLALLAVPAAGLLVAVSFPRLSFRWRRGLLTSGFVVGVLFAGVVFAALKPHAPTQVIDLDQGIQ